MAGGLSFRGSLTCDARSLQRGADGREFDLETAADPVQRRNDRNGDIGGGRSILDGGCAALVGDELLQHFLQSRCTTTQRELARRASARLNAFSRFVGKRSL